MKKYLRIFIIVLAISVITARALCYQAEVADISGAKYLPAVKEALAKAGESIDMVMYQVSLKPYDKTSQVYSLVDELVKAHKRGVKVKVILDQNIDFVGEKEINKWVTEGKNSWCFKILKEAGIDVKYDDVITYAHAKAIVIDNETVILGSANWSDSAFNKNIEANVLIKSKELANEILGYFKGIKIGERAIVEGDVVISWKFLENPALAGRMQTKHDERAFDLYLALLKEFDGNSEGKIVLNYEKVVSYLGQYDKMTEEGYRRQINRGLRKLKDDYKLIDFELDYGKDAQVRLLSYEDPQKPYLAPKEWYFQVPDEYWKYGWSSKLSQSAKFCYLINLAYVNISNASPWWFSSREVLAKRFHISQWGISAGMRELREFNLIDVLYDNPQGRPYESRLANSYKVLPLYEPARLELEWDKLKLAYGLKRLDAARRYAKIVFKQNDPQVVEDIILSIDNFGNEVVKKAFGIAAKKRVDNSKRCYEYVKATIEKIEMVKE